MKKLQWATLIIALISCGVIGSVMTLGAEKKTIANNETAVGQHATKLEAIAVKNSAQDSRIDGLETSDDRIIKQMDTNQQQIMEGFNSLTKRIDRVIERRN